MNPSNNGNSGQAPIDIHLHVRTPNQSMSRMTTFVVEQVKRERDLEDADADAIIADALRFAKVLHAGTSVGFHAAVGLWLQYVASMCNDCTGARFTVATRIAQSTEEQGFASVETERVERCRVPEGGGSLSAHALFDQSGEWERLRILLSEATAHIDQDDMREATRGITEALEQAERMERLYNTEGD